MVLLSSLSLFLLLFWDLLEAMNGPRIVQSPLCEREAVMLRVSFVVCAGLRNSGDSFGVVGEFSR